MKPLFFFLLSISSHLAADPFVLDDIMSREEQKKTGVFKLSTQEKIELENWLNKTFVLKNPGTASETALFLSINIDNGQKLQLSDNSIWVIDPSDIPISSIWISPFEVKIVPSEDPNYPFLIVNTNSGVSVKAKREITPVPKQPD